jgi:integrase
MVKVVAFIRCSPTAHKASVRFRIIDANKVDASHTSEIFIAPDNFDKATQTYKIKANVSSKVRMDFDRQILDRKDLLIKILEGADKNGKLTSAWFNNKVNERLNELVKNKPIDIVPPKAHAKIQPNEEPYLTDIFADFIQKYKISDVRKKNYRVIQRTLQRYELYVCSSRKKNRIALNDITADTLLQIEYFFKNENEIAKDYPKIYQEIPESRQPKPRGDNTISDMMTKMRTFFIWCFKNKLIPHNPFLNYKIKSCVYGSPIYISLEELQQIYETDLSARPALVVQRDIFVFHSLVGCRVSDLMRLTWQNVSNDCIEYIQNKSKHKQSNTIVVPLNDISRAIIQKYKGGEKLLPFISEQKYNKSIKEVFKFAGITRKVIVLNSLTQQEEYVPINTIASSHMCRRNMVGNLYQIVQDTAIIGSMTGHSPNSRAFNRYRRIENEVKKSVIDQLNFKK